MRKRTELLPGALTLAQLPRHRGLDESEERQTECAASCLSVGHLQDVTVNIQQTKQSDTVVSCEPELRNTFCWVLQPKTAQAPALKRRSRRDGQGPKRNAKREWKGRCTLEDEWLFGCELLHKKGRSEQRISTALHFNELGGRTGKKRKHQEFFSYW
ncbi:hypothetical protein AOLI_G00090260 [Acnodon oligacanthus]